MNMFNKEMSVATISDSRMSTTKIPYKGKQGLRQELHYMAPLSKCSLQIRLQEGHINVAGTV
jgi:hypothetical protein